MAVTDTQTGAVQARHEDPIVPPKRLVLCLDGTWNDADGKDITNVVRIRDLVDPKIEHPDGSVEYQRVYYHTGVGTGLSKASNVLDGATGRGLDRNVRSVYKFLSQRYREGMEIYVFGFSRGSFTARSLVGYIGASGLLRPEHCTPENEEAAWQYYRCDPDFRFPSQHEALRKLSFDADKVRIRVLGLFDTVGALGVPVEWFRSWNRKKHQFHDVSLSTIVDYAFHAVAIDEKRGPFQASLWQYPNHRNFQHAEQVWFPGVHGDIGGGYAEVGLSSRTLFWMLSRIEKHGLGLKFIDSWKQRVRRKFDITDTLHESRTALYSWSKLRPMIRVINQRRLELGRLPRLCRLPPHAIPLGEMLDYSVLHRWKTCEDYRPDSVRAALKDTFTLKNPQPIPITGEDGEPLDWVRNPRDRTAVENVLPDEFMPAFKETVQYFDKNPNEDARAFSTPYQEPSVFNW
jgi:uncharacterized protein (DUF2235 family)